MSNRTTPKEYMSTLGPYPLPFLEINYSGAANLIVPTPVVRLLNFSVYDESSKTDERCYVAVNLIASPKSPSFASLS